MAKDRIISRMNLFGRLSGRNNTNQAELPNDSLSDQVAVIQNRIVGVDPLGGGDPFISAKKKDFEDLGASIDRTAEKYDRQDRKKEETLQKMTDFVKSISKHGIHYDDGNSFDIDNGLSFSEFSRQMMKCIEIDTIMKHLPIIPRVIKTLVSDIYKKYTTIIGREKHVNIPDSFNIEDTNRNFLINECEKIFHKYNLDERIEKLGKKVLVYGSMGVLIFPLKDAIQAIIDHGKYIDSKKGKGIISNEDAKEASYSVLEEFRTVLHQNIDIKCGNDKFIRKYKETKSKNDRYLYHLIKTLKNDKNMMQVLESAIPTFSKSFSSEKSTINWSISDKLIKNREYFLFGESNYSEEERKNIEYGQKTLNEIAQYYYNELSLESKNSIVHLAQLSALKQTTQENYDQFCKTIKNKQNNETFNTHRAVYENNFVYQKVLDVARTVDECVNVVEDENEIRNALLVRGMSELCHANEDFSMDTQKNMPGDSLFLEIEGKNILPIGRNGVTLGYYVILTDDMGQEQSPTEDNSPYGWNGNPEMSSSFDPTYKMPGMNGGFMGGIAPMSPYNSVMGGGFDGMAYPTAGFGGDPGLLMGSSMYGYPSASSMVSGVGGVGNIPGTGYNNALQFIKSNSIQSSSTPMSGKETDKEVANIVYSRIFRDIMRKKLEKHRNSKNIPLNDTEINALTLATFEIFKNGNVNSLTSANLLFVPSDMMHYLTFDTYSNGIGKGILDDSTYLAYMAIMNNMISLHARITSVVGEEKVTVPLEWQDMPQVEQFLAILENTLSKRYLPIDFLQSGFSLNSHLFAQMFRARRVIIPDVDGSPLYNIENDYESRKGGLNIDDEFTNSLNEMLLLSIQAPVHAMSMYLQTEEYATSVLTKDAQYRNEIEKFRDKCSNEHLTPIFRSILSHTVFGNMNIRSIFEDREEEDTIYASDSVYDNMRIDEQCNYTAIKDIVEVKMPKEYTIACQDVQEMMQNFLNAAESISKAVFPGDGDGAQNKQNIIQKTVLRDLLGNIGMGDLLDKVDQMEKEPILQARHLLAEIQDNQLRQKLEAIFNQIPKTKDEQSSMGGGTY